MMARMEGRAMHEPNRIFAECPTCKHGIPVVIGRKATVRTVTCSECGTHCFYSAWQLRHPRQGDQSTSVRTFYQVDLFKAEEGWTR